MGKIIKKDIMKMNILYQKMNRYLNYAIKELF